MIESLESKYNGERAFLFGNGPSLNRTPLDQLDSEYTFGVNMINKMYDDVEWRPSFFVTGKVPDHSTFPPVQSKENPVAYHVEAGIPCFLPERSFEFFDERDHIYYYNKWHLVTEKSPFHRMTPEQVKEISIDHLLAYWSMDPSNVIYFYHSLYGVAQIAAYLGFDELYFLGTDLGLEYKNPHMIFENGLDPYRYDGGKSEYISEARQNSVLIPSLVNAVSMKFIQNDFLNTVLERIVRINDGDHFISDYRDSLEIWDGPRFDRELRKSHIAIERISDHLGIDVYNATVGGELEVYPRVDITELV